MPENIGARIRHLRGERSQAWLAREVCKAAGVRGDPVTRKEVSRWETGKRIPREWLPFIAAALDVSVGRLREDGHDRVPLLRLNEAHGSEYAQAIREASQRLIFLDNELTGLPIADVAARTFKSVHRRLGCGDYDAEYERDIRSAASELAEVAGWVLFDAEQHDAARRFNQEALFLARLSGDRSIELLILQNMAMQAGWLGRHREELAVARAVIGQDRLSPRVEAIFRMREARGLAGCGALTEAGRTFKRAQSLLEYDGKGDAPAWSWWIMPNEIDGHHGHALQTAGDHAGAVHFLQLSTERRGGPAVGHRGMAPARLLDCLLHLHAWREAEELVAAIVPTVGETASARTLRLLDEAVQNGLASAKAPPRLRDALKHLDDTMHADPYAL
ncbi:transcriptional regulator [Streptomyces sp. CB02923]|uniref:helix-turn-helix transcriptional regulator n=1 Tax=Streptomyces sp. CB02923 TaxID=1718985 RepID=UPI000939E863|nr:transcriptional regulator [Streptomyces sp. CB02923]OKI05067.1 transcriptional regulator [Streptomyces sp. CB02923]